MKLWVDDIRSAPDESWTVARTVGAAISALARFGDDLEEVSLDHDISHQVAIGTGLERPFPCTETFQPVAWFIAYRFTSPSVPNITLHSSNPAGRADMEAIMRTRLDFEKHLLIQAPMGAANRLEMVV